MTYDSTLNRIEISNIETIGTYTRMFSRSIRTSPGRCPNHPSQPRIVASPTTMKIRPTAMMNGPSDLLPTINSYRRNRSPLLGRRTHPPVHYPAVPAATLRRVR